MYLVRVGSCEFVDRPCFSGQKERSTKSHELNTKLVTTPIDFWGKANLRHLARPRYA